MACCKRSGMPAPRGRPGGVAAGVGDQREALQCRVQKPSQPDAFSTARRSHPVHAVVPIPRTEQRQTVRAHGKTGIERADAMFVQRCRLDRGCGSRKEFRLPGRERAALEKAHALIEHGGSPVTST